MREPESTGGATRACGLPLASIQPETLADAHCLRHRNLAARAQRRLAHRRANRALPALARPPGRADPSAPARRGAARRRRRAAHRRLRDSRCIPTCASGWRAPAPWRGASGRAGPIWCTWRRPGRCPGRRSPRRGALGLATTSDFRTNFHQYSRHYGLGLFAGQVLGLLRRFHNLTRAHLRADAGGAARARAAGFHNLTRRRPRRRHRALHAGGRSAALRAQWQAGPETPVLLAVGRVAAEKNIELALRAFERARRDRPDLRMVVVGDGPARARLAVGASGGDASSACSAAPSWRPTTPRPTRSCSPAFPTPSATSSWRRSLPACRWSRSTAPRPPSTSPTASAAGSSRPATRPASSSPRPRSRSRPAVAANRCAPPPSPRRAAPPGPKCSRASRPACRTPSMRSKRRLPRVPVVA